MVPHGDESILNKIFVNYELRTNGVEVIDIPKSVQKYKDDTFQCYRSDTPELHDVKFLFTPYDQRSLFHHLKNNFKKDGSDPRDSDEIVRLDLGFKRGQRNSDLYLDDCGEVLGKIPTCDVSFFQTMPDKLRF